MTRSKKSKGQAHRSSIGVDLARKSRSEIIGELASAFSQKNLTLYLGAGVSVGSGLPTWDRLVLAMYFSTMADKTMKGWRPFPNYLYAIAEFHLKRGQEPLEITARKVRKDRPGDQFFDELRKALYQGFIDPYSEAADYPDANRLRSGNPTLAAVARLIEKGEWPSRGVKSVVTYNYDNLLETVLGVFPHQPVFHGSGWDTTKMPIYHVHGFVPLSDADQGSNGEEIVFTEDQYHLTAQDSYSWSNLVQIQAMSSSVGLMIGLSLSDRNMRRLLDAVGQAPVGARNYAILNRPSWTSPKDYSLDEIHEKAIDYMSRFTASGVKPKYGTEEVMYSKPKVKSSRPDMKSVAGGPDDEPRYRYEIRGILKEVERFDSEQQEYVLRQLGVQPIWYDDYQEIPQIIGEISGKAGGLA
jgi:SIR2-like domain